jgi:polyribonucleotide nucleotidyltransferase
VQKCFDQALAARLEILDVMASAIAEPRTELSPYAPRIITLRISPELIGNVIGPGGKMINEIISTTGVQSIDIEDDGLVMITSTDAEGAEKARQWVTDLTREVAAGEVFKGKVTRLMDFGAFVEVLPKQEGLVHISELAPWRVNAVSDIVKVGDTVHVKVKEIDDLGRMNLSMKDAEGNVYPEKPASTGTNGGGDFRKKPGTSESRPPRKPSDSR